MAKITSGNYVAVAESFDFGVSSNGNDFIKLSFKIIEGEFADQYLTWFGYFSEATHKRTLESLRYCGWSGTTIDEAMAGLGSQKVRIVVEEEEYNGKSRLKVQWVNKVGAPKEAQNRLDGGGLAALNARLSSAISTTPVEEGEKLAGAVATRIGTEATQGGTTDMPF